MSDVEAKLAERGLLPQFRDECARTGLTLPELLRSQAPPAPEARRRLYRWLRDEKGYSLARIGRLFGKSHSSVHYALSTQEATEP